MAEIKKYFSNMDKRIIFLGICLIYIGIVFITERYLLTDNLYYNVLSTQLDNARVSNFLDLKKQWSFLGYILLPIMLLVKWGLIASSIKAGAIIKDYEIKFKKIFHIIMISEFVFILLAIVKIIWLFVFKEVNTIEDVVNFYPLSLINFFNSSLVEKHFLYPLQVINLFEIIYWFVLSYLLSTVIQKTFWKSFEFVLSTYVVGLLLWVTFIVFLTLNLN